MLNEYFTEMVEVIFTRGGMLDKYMGDGLMAIFGAPVVGAADADNALYVANDMVRALAALNAKRAERGFESDRDGHRSCHRRGAAPGRSARQSGWSTRRSAAM